MFINSNFLVSSYLYLVDTFNKFGHNPGSVFVALSSLAISSRADQEGMGIGDMDPMENHKWLCISLQLLIRIPSRSNWTQVQLILEGSSYGPYGC